ncbi:MAG: PEP-CTERM sorting domain-containing protein [Bryobacteraceae bacterium]
MGTLVVGSLVPAVLVIVAIPLRAIYTLKTMSFSRIASPFAISFALLFSGVQSVKADAIFNFESTAQNTHTPFTDTVNGLSATFSGSASVCPSDGLFQSLSGNVLIQGLIPCGLSTESGPLPISFSSDLTGISFNFGTAGGTGTLTLTAFANATSVGTATFTSTLPSGRFNGEGIASFSGTFNRLTLTSSNLLALDNINASTSTAAVPEPASFATIAAGIGLLAAFVRRKRQAR